MLSRIKDLFKSPEAILEKEKIDVNKKRNQDFDFRGKRKDLEQPGRNILGVKKDSILSAMEEHEPRLQNRSVRYKSLGYLFLFACWNVAVVGFIMYRVRGNDLEELEKEAKERIKNSKSAKTKNWFYEFEFY